MDDNDQRDSSTGLIIGMIIGGVLALAIVIVGFLFLPRSRVELPPVMEGSGEAVEKVLPDEAAKVGS